jgi:ribose transport system ATP-binding protein
MDQLAAEGRGVILISSDLPEILGLTDRVAVFREGLIAAVLDTRATSQEEIMRHASVRTPVRTSNESALAAAAS